LTDIFQWYPRLADYAVLKARAKAPASARSRALVARSRTISGGHCAGETPLPIPNRAVKPCSADGTWDASPWESRSPPVSSFTSRPLGGSWSLCAGSCRPDELTGASRCMWALSHVHRDGVGAVGIVVAGGAWVAFPWGWRACPVDRGSTRPASRRSGPRARSAAHMRTGSQSAGRCSLADAVVEPDGASGRGAWPMSAPRQVGAATVAHRGARCDAPCGAALAGVGRGPRSTPRADPTMRAAARWRARTTLGPPEGDPSVVEPAMCSPRPDRRARPPRAGAGGWGAVRRAVPGDGRPARRRPVRAG
jgi:hypothetical protein